MGKQKPRKRWYIVFMLVISIVIMICLFSGNNFVEQANKPLTMKTITVRIESSNKPYEKGPDFDISQYKEEYIRFSGKVIVSHLLTVLKKQRKLLGNYGMLYSIMILKR